MKHIWNSLLFQMSIAFGGSAILVVIFLIITGQGRQLTDARTRQAITATKLTGRTYEVIAAAHLYIEYITDSQRPVLKNNIEQLVNDTQNLKDTLSIEEEELHDITTDRIELDLLIEEVNAHYQTFAVAVENFFASDPEKVALSLETLQTEGTALGLASDRLEIAIENVAKEEQAHISNIIILTAIAIVTMLFIATIVIIQSMRAINSLISTTRAFAEGNYKVRANLRTVNEIALVGKTFNQMADHLSNLLDELEQQVVAAEQARAQAEKSDQVKSSFLASMSHELRTPLNAIINFSKFVIKGVMGPVTSEQTEALNKVVVSGKHLLSLINDVLDISKIESGSLTLFMEPNIDIGEILHQTAALSEALLESKPVNLQMDIANTLPHLHADRQRLRQIFTNIISNACKFTQEGHIKITAYAQDSEVKISIEDTGAGIAMEDYDLVFESFKQTNTGLRQGNGTGLGMPISKSLTEALGGKLWFESEVGKGSTFFISLPVKSEQPVVATA